MLKCIRKDTREYKEDDVKEKFPEEFKKCQQFSRPLFLKGHSDLIDQICETNQSVQFKELKK